VRIAPLEEIIWQKAYIMERLTRDLMDELLRRLGSEQNSAAPGTTVCNGTLLSRHHFISDVESNGLLDARSLGRSVMTSKQIKKWTEAAIDEAHFDGR
jgi:hypothetical protein